MKRTNDFDRKNDFGLPNIGIPAEALLHPELSSTEKILFGYIRNLSYTERGCWASNAYLGGLIGVGTQTISNGVRNLKEYGFIYVKYHRKSNGRQERRIHINDKYHSHYSKMLQNAYKIINSGALKDIKNLYTHIKKFITPYKNLNTNNVIDNDKEDGSKKSNKKRELLDPKETISKYSIHSKEKWNKDSPIDYESFVNYFNKVSNSQCRMTDGKKKDIKKQLKTFTGQEIKKALKNRSIALNDNQYLTSWESIFARKVEKMEKYLTMSPSKFNGKPKPAAGYNEPNHEFQQEEDPV